MNQTHHEHHQSHVTENKKPTHYLIIGLIILAGIIYLVSASNLFGGKKNTLDTIEPTGSTASCTVGSNGGSCGCGGGAKKTSTSSATPAPKTIVQENLTYETVKVSHDGYNLDPETVTLVAGKNYKIVITPAEDGRGCMYSMTVPGIDENVYNIKKGVPITIIINNAKAGSYDVVCGSMGMYQGVIVVQ